MPPPASVALESQRQKDTVHSASARSLLPPTPARTTTSRASHRGIAVPSSHIDVDTHSNGSIDASTSAAKDAVANTVERSGAPTTRFVGPVRAVETDAAPTPPPPLPAPTQLAPEVVSQAALPVYACCVDERTPGLRVRSLVAVIEETPSPSPAAEGIAAAVQSGASPPTPRVAGDVASTGASCVPAGDGVPALSSQTPTATTRLLFAECPDVERAVGTSGAMAQPDRGPGVDIETQTDNGGEAGASLFALIAPAVRAVGADTAASGDPRTPVGTAVHASGAVTSADGEARTPRGTAVRAGGADAAADCEARTARGTAVRAAAAAINRRAPVAHTPIRATETGAARLKREVRRVVDCCTQVGVLTVPQQMAFCKKVSASSFVPPSVRSAPHFEATLRAYPSPVRTSPSSSQSGRHVAAPPPARAPVRSASGRVLVGHTERIVHV